MVRMPVNFGASLVEGLSFVGLAVPEREAAAGRLGGTDAVLPPIVVRLALSAAESDRGPRGVAVPPVDTPAGRLFSAPSAGLGVAPWSPALAAGLRAEGTFGRVGGLLMVAPVVRAVNALVRGTVGAVAAAVAILGALGRSAASDSFFASSFAAGLADAAIAVGLAPVVFRFSIPLRSSHPRARRVHVDLLFALPSIRGYE